MIVLTTIKYIMKTVTHPLRPTYNLLKVYVDVQFKMLVGIKPKSKHSIDDVVKERRKM